MFVAKIFQTNFMKSLCRAASLALLFCLAATAPIFSQPKTLSQQDIHRWKKIEQERISSDGRWVAYVLESTTEADPILCLWDGATEQTKKWERATEPRLSFDANYLIFRIKPPLDSLKAMRRRKVKDDDLPKDSLGIFNLKTGKLDKIGRVKNFSIPEKWSGWLAFQLESAPPDTSAAAKQAGKKLGKEGKEKGWRLVVEELATGRKDTLPFVKEFVFAEKTPRLLFHTTGRDSTLPSGVYFYRNLENSTAAKFEKQFNFGNAALTPIFQSKGKFQKLALDKTGRQVAFLADLDTTKVQIRPWQLGFWNENQPSAELISQRGEAQLLFEKKNSTVSEHASPQFSDDGSKLFFGIAPPPVLPDTTRLPEEIVNVEVWTSRDDYIFTMQKKRLEEERKRSFAAAFRTAENRFVQVGSEALPEVRFVAGRDADLALAWTEKPYAQELIWDGTAHLDLFSVDLKTGAKKLIVKNLRGFPTLSPSGKFAIWYSQPDSAWFVWNAREGQLRRLTDNRKVNFFDEENDVPDLPDPHGLAAWTEGDESVLIYDKFDIWQFDPTGDAAPLRLTRGRERQQVFRYLKLDSEEKFVQSEAEIFLHRHSEIDHSEGYEWLDLASGQQTEAWKTGGGNFAYSRRPMKAARSWDILFTRENFDKFPDLQLAGSGKIRQVSRTNPQQSEYRWGSIELVEWTALDGQRLRGMLVKPPDFDPQKKYPLVVNFYEKSSQTVLSHRAPDAHRSQINYSIFASRGYLIFNPDVVYRTGYPGAGAENCVLSGVNFLISKGFVDEKRIGIQGHSWGGYQAAHLITKTNLFACAEAGAAVVNMFSAYGGIRWESGRSRIFQYEHQQSRIGGSIWEYPMRFLENSPLFSLDKVQTPVLIMHNDMDGAVPWEQGIEFYTALTRLGKRAWMLNYNDEPHWPVKLQNRLDFQIRMEQFFDHFLLSKPAPSWMLRGVPALEKGILQGLELEKN